MTRRTAAARFCDVRPPDSWPRAGEGLAEAIRALSHPGRRALLDSLSAQGPASVGQLARRAGMAAGSASHHLGVLARAGFITPAPDLAGDTRESWWRTQRRSLTWGEGTFAPGTAGAELAHLAGAANLDYLLGRIRTWQSRRGEESWDGVVTDTVTIQGPATVEAHAINGTIHVKTVATLITWAAINGTVTLDHHANLVAHGPVNGHINHRPDDTPRRP